MPNESDSKPTIQQIFNNMEYGSISEAKSSAEAWLRENDKSFGCFINGKFYADKSEKSEIISTGFNKSFSLFLNKEEDYSSALSASSSSFNEWSKLDAHLRGSIIYNIARQLQKHSTLLCELEALSRGVLVSNVREFDVPALIRLFYYYAGWAHLAGTEFKQWKPYGPVVALTSSNSPLVSLGMYLAPALAGGNTITILPHVSNCLSAFLLAQLCTSAGVPSGVVNVVPQDHSDVEVCPAITSHLVKKLAFIGSPILGRSILCKSSLPYQDHAILLNGCNPMVVLDSADIDAVVDCVVDAAWINQGQDPWSLGLLVVQESVYSSLKSKLSTRIASLKVGSTFEKMVDVSGAAVDQSIAKRLLEICIADPHCEVVKAAGLETSNWAPTAIFSASPPSGPVLQTAEVCPLLYVVAARSAKEAIGIANHCGGGAAASVWTESSAFAWEAATQIKSSTVWINSFGSLDASTPICGRNSTGKGSFSGKEGFLEFLQPVSEEKAADSNYRSSFHLKTVPAAPDSPDIDQTYKLFYGGGHKRPSSNIYKTLDSNGKQIAVIPEANRKDIRNAVESAVKLQPGWWKRGPHNRAQIIYNLAEKLKARRNHFASILHNLYQTNNMTTCLDEVSQAVNFLLHFAAICDKTAMSTNQTVGGMTVVIQREPLGLIAIFYTAAVSNAFSGLISLIGAALALGNACLLVTDLECSTPALELAQLLEASEVPAGVINILSGDALALLHTVCGHMDVNAVWFAGSSQKANTVMKQECSKSNLKQCWVFEKVLNPLEWREIYEIKASHSKAIWLSGVASF